MSINPFKVECKEVNEYFMNWDQMYPTSYDKNKVSPWTKVRVILMNGTEFESNWFLHQFARLLLVEQIYRAFKILKNETYHK